MGEILCGLAIFLAIGCLFASTFGIAGIVMYFKAIHNMESMSKNICVVVSNDVYTQQCSDCNYVKVGNNTVCIRYYWTCYQAGWKYAYTSHDVNYTNAQSQSGYSSQRSHSSAENWVNRNYPVNSAVDCWTDGPDVVYSEPSTALGIGLMSTGFGVFGIAFLIWFFWALSTCSCESTFCKDLCNMDDLCSCCLSKRKAPTYNYQPKQKTRSRKTSRQINQTQIKTDNDPPPSYSEVSSIYAEIYKYDKTPEVTVPTAYHPV